MTATPETEARPATARPVDYLRGMAYSMCHAIRLTKEGDQGEASGHVDAIERLIAAYRDAVSGSLPATETRQDELFQRRIYVDGEGDPWIEVPISPDDGSVSIVQLREDVDVAAPAEEIRENTGGLREIGRCA